jgi:hypothetical protein
MFSWNVLWSTVLVITCTFLFGNASTAAAKAADGTGSE